jgi:hypothetical protein
VTCSENVPIPGATESLNKANAQPRTFAELLDAAQTAEEFQHIINLLFIAAFNATRHRGSGAPERESE